MPIEYIITEDVYSLFAYDENWDSMISNLKEDFKYGDCIFDGYTMNKHIYFLAMDNDILVGVLKFKVGGSDSCSNPGFKNWICFIETRKSYRNKGISNTLKKMLFEYCQQNDMNILSSGFTLLGHKYNMRGYIELAKKYNVEYCYQDCVRFPNFNNYEGMKEKEYMEYYEKHKPDWDSMYEYITINKRK